MKTKDISGAELTVMKVLWEADRAMTVHEVCDALTESDWKYKTVATLLLWLEEKGAVRSDKDGRANLYTPVLDREKYTRSRTKSFIDGLYDGSVRKLVASLVHDEMSEEDVEEIRKMFDL